MKSSKITHIQYEKATNIGGEKGEITERYVIPTFVPVPNMKALDVTNMSDEERKEMETAYAEYTQYYKLAVSKLFTFEDWLTHSRGEKATPELKWRTFKLDNVKILD